MSRALRLRELAQITDGSLLDLAVITPDGLDSWKAETANTCNNGQSTIKLFVSICIGMLWDAGVLDLQEKAAALFPACWTAEMDPRWRDVTVENVLRHRIGFEAVHIDYEGETVCCGGEDSLITLFRTPLPHPQGSFYRYSDAAYYLLARIIEVKAGMTLEAFIRRQLARPMGFRDFAIASDPLGHTLGGGCMSWDLGRPAAAVGRVYSADAGKRMGPDPFPGQRAVCQNRGLWAGHRLLLPSSIGRRLASRALCRPPRARPKRHDAGKPGTAHCTGKPEISMLRGFVEKALRSCAEKSSKQR